MDTAMTAAAKPVGFLEKVRVVLAALVAIALLSYVGWMVARPIDPEMAVTFTAGSRSILAIWPALLVLTVVSAAVGSAIAGPRLPEAGMFAGAVGLAGLALHGGSMEMLLAYVAGVEGSGRRSLMFAMAIDSVLWAALPALAWLVVLMVSRWLWGAPVAQPAVKRAAKDDAAKGRSLLDMMGSGTLALAVTSVVALFFIWMTVARTPVATIARGQVIASVFFGLYLGAMAARYFTGLDHARYYMAAPLVVAIVGYLLGYLQAGMGWASGPLAAYAQLATTAPHALARPLPIEYIGVGLAGVIAGFWSGERIEAVAEKELELS